jgi:outer membrane receptor protein involved in Fe transport
LTYGSSGRKAVRLSMAAAKRPGSTGFWPGFGFHESGWRFDSPSDVRQGFARLGWRTDKTDIALTMSYAYNTLIGNGLQDYRLLETNYSSVYSIPDSTANRSPSFNFIARHTFSDKLTFSGNAWYRNIRTEGIDANFNTDALGQSIYQPTAEEQAVLSAAGYTGFPTSGANIARTRRFRSGPASRKRCSWAIRTRPAMASTSTRKKCRTSTDFPGRFTWITSPPEKSGRNQFTAGAAWTAAASTTRRTRLRLCQSQLHHHQRPGMAGRIDQRGWRPVDSRVNLHGLTPNWSLYFTDTLTLAKTVNVTVSGRYNRFTVDNTDRINPIPGPGSLDGDYVFQRFNPAIGITWSPISTVNAYARYSQGSRAPTAIELGCADPANPCSLPNALASDPPLQQVVTGHMGSRPAREAGDFVRPQSELECAGRSGPKIATISSSSQPRGDRHRLFPELRQNTPGGVRCRSRRAHRARHLGPGLHLSVGHLSEHRDPGRLGEQHQRQRALQGYPGLDGNIYIQPAIAFR